MTKRPGLAREIMLVLSFSGLIACSEDPPPPRPATAPTATPTASSSPTSASLPAPAPTSSAGAASVTVEAGRFHVGSQCAEVPRHRARELAFEKVALGAYAMDRLPYPNRTGEPARTNVTWNEAQQLCEKESKRLCTELEWERACKGTAESIYPWGNTFDGDACPRQEDGRTGLRPACVSGYGLADMVGIAGEWTASDDRRLRDPEKPSGPANKIIRGAGPVGWLTARCARSESRDPKKAYVDVGFRCCRGTPNAAEVVLAPDPKPPLEPLAKLTDAEVAALLKAMPKHHREIPDVTVSLDRALTWRPVPHEELLVVRWKGTPKKKDRRPYYELVVFKRCEDRTHVAARMKGPVAEVKKPRLDGDRQVLKAAVTTDTQEGELTLRFSHGKVTLVEPGWVQRGNRLEPPPAGDGRGRCPADMVLSGSVCIDRYEAPNVKGRSPYAFRTASEGEAWCKARDKRLCTDVEWERACRGRTGTKLPYGNEHEPGRCADDKPWLSPNWPVLATHPNPAATREADRLYDADPSGQRPGCVTADGAFDMTGNVAEWVKRTRNFHSQHDHVLVGCYWSGCFKGVTPHCGFANTAHPGDFRTAEAGFRCCKAPADRP